LGIAVVTWIERELPLPTQTCSTGRLTPIEFETIMNTTVALAA
jgi:putative transposase